MKIVGLIEQDDQVIFLAGNLSDGFKPFGPYKNYNECAAAHSCDEGWMMALEKPKDTRNWILGEEKEGEGR